MTMMCISVLTGTDVILVLTMKFLVYIIIPH